MRIVPPGFVPPRDERGAALLTVLLLVAVMSVIAATALDRLALATRLAGNSSAMSQARAYGYAAEVIAASRIEDILLRDAAKVTRQGDWLDRELPFPLDRGSALVRISDGANCFNLNSLVQQSQQGQQKLTPWPPAIAQLASLLQLRGVDQQSARIIAESAADWIDSDSSNLPAGAEDGYYRGQEPGYLPANGLMADRSEILAVRGMTPEIYAKLRENLCALPEAVPVQININTLRPDQAVLLAMLFDQQLPEARARALLAARPPSGYSSLVNFWQTPLLASLDAQGPVREQIALKSRWFFLDTLINIGETGYRSHSLIQADNGQVSVRWRSLGEGS